MRIIIMSVRSPQFVTLKYACELPNQYLFVNYFLNLLKQGSNPPLPRGGCNRMPLNYEVIGLIGSKLICFLFLCR